MKRLLITCTIIFQWLSCIYSQSCDAQLTPDSSILLYAYQPRPGSSRCEGLIRKNVSSATRPFTVISVLIGKLAYELNEKEVLHIKAPSSRKYKTLRVTGASFNHKKNYRIDMDLKEGEEKHIPVKAILAPNYFYPYQIGFCSTVETETDYYVPLIITSEYYKEVVADSLLVVSFLCGMNL